MNAEKTEHSGAKNGGGFWGTRKRAKQFSKTKRRHQDKIEVEHQTKNTDQLTKEYSKFIKQFGETLKNLANR